MNIDLLIAFIVLGVLAILAFPIISIWVTATFSGVKMSIYEIIFMLFRKSPVKEIVRGLITLTKVGVPAKSSDLELHSMAGGNVSNVVRGLVLAKNKNIGLNFKQACKIDLDGHDVMDFVKHAEKKLR